MDDPFLFMSYFPNMYPVQRTVNMAREPGLVGLLIKSIMHDQQQNSLLCRTLAIHGPNHVLHHTFTMRVKDISPVVGYDLDLHDSSSETWERVKIEWSRYMKSEPVKIMVRQDDIKMHVNAQVFPLVSVDHGNRYMNTVDGALNFGDFGENGYYMSRDGNVPALCSGVMFGRVYFLPEARVDQLSKNTVVSPQDLIYDHSISEASALAFETKLSGVFLNAACLNIETVFEERYRSPQTRCQGFALEFPQCTENKVETLRALALVLERELAGKVVDELGKTKVDIPTLSEDVAGQQHEITCISLVLLHSNRPKEQGKHRKTLMVFYNNGKVNGPELNRSTEAALNVGIEDPGRINIIKCDSEFHLLCQVLTALTSQNIELLYMYNAGFDLRVLEQRVCFYESRCCECGHFGVTRKQGSKLRALWDRLFVSEKFGSMLKPVFEFEMPRMIIMYESMLKKMQTLTVHAYMEAKERFKLEKKRIGHFKMNSCGTNVIDLFRMAQTRSIKSGCPRMKLSEVVSHVVQHVRLERGEPPKNRGKLHKLSQVSSLSMDEMIKSGGKGLFMVLLNTLINSQLCARLARVLDPVSSLFHRCRSTLNTDVIVHGRCNTFGGFVQSIHAVQIPQLKYKLDNLRCVAGPKGRELENRVPWTMKASNESWQGGFVCDPMTGLHYSGPGMGLELTFDFASMYPSIMSALNISFESTVPWPPKDFDHDLSGWLCYNWEAEGFKCASLIMKYCNIRQTFIRNDGIMNASMERYHNRRAQCKQQLKDPGLSKDRRAYLELQMLECKVLLNSFYGTAGACGPLISAAGRRQFSVVRECISEFFNSKRSELLYGDTDSVMLVVGYGPQEEPEPELDDRVDEAQPDTETSGLAEFSKNAREAIILKLARAEMQVPAFRKFVHKRILEDMLSRLYLIGHKNSTQKAVKAPNSGETVDCNEYIVRMSGGSEIDITEPFMENIRINLEYENSSSIICHQNKKMYLSLSHTVDSKTGELQNVNVKVRGISASKSMPTPSDLGMSEVFIACVMRGDCLKLHRDSVSCFSTVPWHQLVVGDCMLFNRNKIEIDRVTGLWLGVAEAKMMLSRHTVEMVKVLEFDAGFSAVAVTLSDVSSGKRFQVRTLYKDKLYCLNHLFSSAEAVRRDLVATCAAELVSSQIACGFFPWRRLLKCNKDTNMKQEVVRRLRVDSSSTKTTYIETLLERKALQRITGLSTIPSLRPGDEKVKPCEAVFYRYPLDLKAKTGCLGAMFGTCFLPQCSDAQVAEAMSVAQLCQPISRVLLAREADKCLVNGQSKMTAYCIVDYCLSRYMYNRTPAKERLATCSKHLFERLNIVTERLERAENAFLNIMNNCPLHMIPVCGQEEREYINLRRTTVYRLPVDKLDLVTRVVIEDMSLNPEKVYRSAIANFGSLLTKALNEGTATLTVDRVPDNGSVSVSVPRQLLDEAEVRSSGTWISLCAGDCDHGELLDMAGSLYQAVLTKQVHEPVVFPETPANVPHQVLYIMPFSNNDQQAVQKWLSAFGKMDWLKKTDPRNRSAAKRICLPHPMYHCLGCESFFQKLATPQLSISQLEKVVYNDMTKTRRFGRCLNEIWR